jgi:hypothetical protein
MKKALAILCILLYSCSSTKNIKSEDVDVLEQHPKPFTIFGVGSYSHNYMILTLIDAKGEYFTVKVPANTSLKKGLTYASYASE